MREFLKPFESMIQKIDNLEDKIKEIFVIGAKIRKLDSEWKPKSKNLLISLENDYKNKIKELKESYKESKSAKEFKNFILIFRSCVEDFNNQKT